MKKNDFPPFQLGKDYYIDVNGNWVFTAEYLKKRGYCCKNGCKHCPYGYPKKHRPPQ